MIHFTHIYKYIRKYSYILPSKVYDFLIDEKDGLSLKSFISDQIARNNWFKLNDRDIEVNVICYLLREFRICIICTYIRVVCVFIFLSLLGQLTTSSNKDS